MSYQGSYCWTQAEAKKHTARWSKELHEYWTYVKGEACDSSKPEECWALTDKFDPDIRKQEKQI